MFFVIWYLDSVWNFWRRIPSFHIHNVPGCSVDIIFTGCVYGLGGAAGWRDDVFSDDLIFLYLVEVVWKAAQFSKGPICLSTIFSFINAGSWCLTKTPNLKMILQLLWMSAVLWLSRRIYSSSLKIESFSPMVLLGCLVDQMGALAGLLGVGL